MSAKTVPAIMRLDRETPPARMALAAAGVAVFVSIAALMVVLRQPAPPVFITVSMKSIVEEHMLATIGADIGDFEAELRTREFAHALDTAIGDLAGDAQVVALASEAVIGSGVPDFTEEVRLRTEALARAYAAQRGVTLPPPADASGLDAVMSGFAAETEAMRRRIDSEPQENSEAME